MLNITTRNILGVIAALIAIFAGLALAFTESAAEDATIFDALMQGIGLYIVCRGIWMIYEMIRDSKTA